MRVSGKLFAVSGAPSLVWGEAIDENGAPKILITVPDKSLPVAERCEVRPRQAERVSADFCRLKARSAGWTGPGAVLRCRGSAIFII